MDTPAVRWDESKLRAFREAEARFTTAWQNLIEGVRASAPRRECRKARREYLDARAALEDHGRVHVESALARCMREDRKRRGVPEYNYWTDDLDGGLQDPEADYWRREREDAAEAERIVESSMLLGERVDKTIEGAIEFTGSVIGALFKVAGAIFLLWMFIWLVKTLWYLS